MAKRLGVVAVIGLGLLLAAELLVRVQPVTAMLQDAYPRTSPIEQEIKLQESTVDPRFVADSDLGNRPASERHDTFTTPDYAYLVETDSAGFPNREPWPTRVDVVALGNSLIVGPGVGIDGQFSTLLGRKLGGAAVLNFGLGGGPPELQYYLYRRYAAARRPRIVLACLWVASDVDNALHYDRWHADGRRQDFYQYRTSYGRTHPGPRARTNDYLKRGSYLLNTVSGVLRTLERQRKYTERVEFPSGEVIYLSARAQERLARGMTRRELPNLRAVFFDPLVRLRDTVEAQGGRLVVVLIPSKEELYGAERFPAVLQTIAEVKAGLDSLGLRSLDLYGPIQRRAGEASPFFRRDIHLNALGNELTAAVIAEWITADDQSNTPKPDDSI